MMGVRAKFLRTFELDDTIFRKCRFLENFPKWENDVKLLILEKVPFIKPFDHFLISRKYKFNANFKFFGNGLRNFEKLQLFFSQISVNIVYKKGI